MAYHAVICLMCTAKRLTDSDRISFRYEGCREFLERTYSAMTDLVDVLEKNDKRRRNVISAGERMMCLEAELREAASELEDSIESLLSAHILSQSESTDPSLIPPIFSIDLRELHGGESDPLECFLSMAGRMEAAYEEDGVGAVVSPPIYFDGGDPPRMVGFADQLYQLKQKLVDRSHRYIDVSISGMAGIGKTTLTKKLLEDPQIKKRFERRIFVPVGLETEVNYESQFKRVLLAILAQVKPDDGDAVLMDEVENLDESFWKRLNNENTLIVLDDLWSAKIWSQLRRILPLKHKSCKMLVTTRTRAAYTKICSNTNYKMRFMDKEESWDLLRGKVFGEESRVPYELEKPGKMIAENCEGLPLLLIAVANLLSAAEKTLEFWTMVAADKENHIFVNAYDQISEVLLPSYYNLPQDIKPSFLYLRAFPQNYQFRCSRLTKLLSGEDIFLTTNIKGYINNHLGQLCNDCVLLVSREFIWNGVEIYSLHSSFWYLCKKQAEKIKVLQTFNKYVDGSSESIEGQRRLAIYKNVLLGIKHIYNVVASVPNARSLLCTGAFHKYQVPICFGYLKLLRVLDALTIRFYVFPTEVLQLILLRYLALTCNGNLSHLISKIWNLQCLILHKHLSIKSTLAESYVPVEIWNLQELKYLEIMGRNLRDPPPGASLPMLSTLLDVDAHSCTENVLQSIPELKKLRVQIELAPDATECLTCLDHISRPPKLKSFQCIVKNPNIAAPPPPLPIFGSNLKKLILRGVGYPWKEMDKIAGLPSLKVLKLQCYAFRGPRWEANNGFLKLTKLCIEDTDLVQWSSNDETFPSLNFLTLENCYRLHKIPYPSTLCVIKLVDCNPTVLTSTKQMKDCGFKVSVRCSWDEENLKQ